MGEAELGRIDIPTGDGGVKKSFQILHGNRASWMLCVLVVKLFALLVVAGLGPTTFQLPRNLKRKRGHHRAKSSVRVRTRQARMLDRLN